MTPTLAERLREMVECEPGICAGCDIMLEAATALDEREAALADALRTWTFDEGQRHTHTWHDREDWRERHAKALTASGGAK